LGIDPPCWDWTVEGNCPARLGINPATAHVREPT
jgi:hypothetical protein